MEKLKMENGGNVICVRGVGKLGVDKWAIVMI